MILTKRQIAALKAQVLLYAAERLKIEPRLTPNSAARLLAQMAHDVLEKKR